MRGIWLVCMLLPALPAAAVDRVELGVGRIEGAGWHAHGARVDWQVGGRLTADIRDLRTAALPGPIRAHVACARLSGEAGVGCDDLGVHADVGDAGTLDARLAARWRDMRHWRLDLRSAQIDLSYNSADGRLATDRLRLSLRGEASARGAQGTLVLQARADAGQAYAEPVFVDFAAQPATLDAALSWTSAAVELARLHIEQAGVGTASLSGRVDVAAPAAGHDLELQASLTDAGAATASYLQPFLATTRLRNIKVNGAVDVRAALRDSAPQALQVRLRGVDVEAPAADIALTGIDGDVRWQPAAPAPSSHLAWQGGRIGRLPLGAVRTTFASAGRSFVLTDAMRLPVLDGAIDIERLSLTDVGLDSLGADVAIRVEPIDLEALCRSLGWPEFSGTLSGTLPGLQLRDRQLEIDGALRASAFDGDIEVRSLTVIEPFGVLPRVSADLTMRRLDLAAVTSAFDFGRITGRLDGDFRNLRLIGWEPVAMDARLYSTPGDDSRKRISQRAIDSISSIGGGPTGLLSRGFFSLFEDFAYARIGWSCELDNGVCRMNGIGPARNDRGGPDGYVLVQGRGLPRIDVVGYTRRVSWPVFVAQLKGIGKSGPAQVR